jgi:hypothetical protein
MLFPDKVHFTRNGINNTRNSHYWAQEIHRRYRNVNCNRDFESKFGVEYQAVIWLDRVLSRDVYQVRITETIQEMNYLFI